MWWHDFDEATAMERDLLHRALPLTPTVSTGSLRVRVDESTGQVGVALAVSDVLGPTPDGCVELLGIRPLLFATAWKVIDVFVEAILIEGGAKPDQLNGFRIATKTRRIREGLSQDLLQRDVWEALGQVYVSTEDLRHSLIHRRAWLDESGALLGQDRESHPLAPVTIEEQDAFVRAAMRLGEAASHGSPVDSRTEMDLRAWLSRLPAMQNVLSGDQDGLPGTVMELTVILERDPSSRLYELDVPRLLSLPNVAGHSVADLVIEFADQPGIVSKGRLEDAPRERLRLDPADMPGWLQ